MGDGGIGSEVGGGGGLTERCRDFMAGWGGVGWVVSGGWGDGGWGMEGC